MVDALQSSVHTRCAMLSLSWPLRCVPYAVAVGLALAAVFLASTSEQSSSASGALSRHPSSRVYSDLPYRNPLPVVLLSVSAHWLLFRFFPLPAAWRAASGSGHCASDSGVVQRNSCVSTVHAVVAVCCVLLWLAVYDVEWRSVQRGMGGGKQGTGDEWQSAAVGWSLGYFVYDAGCMVRHRSVRSGQSLLHHAAIGAAFALGLCTDCCRPFHFLFLLEELSTPWLNLKSLLRHRARLADACAAVFAVSFVCVRLGYGLTVYVLACMQLGPFVSQAVADGEMVQAAAAVFQFVLCTASRLLNLFWTALIARKVRRAMTGAPRSDRQWRRAVSEASGTRTETAGGGGQLD